MMRTGAMALAALSVLAATSPVRGDEPAVRLDYRASSACPSATAVARAVTARLGRDPFADDAAIVLRAVIEPAGTGWRARIEWLEDGRVTGTRALASEAPACRALAAAVALALAIAIDPLADTGEPIELEPEPVATAPPPPPPAAVPPPPPPAAVAPAVDAPAPLAWAAGAGPVATIGAAPRWTPAMAGLVEASRGPVALGLHLQVHWPRAEPAGPGEVSGWLATATLAPCLSRGGAAACALASAGFVRGRGAELDESRRSTTGHVAVGARGQWTFWRGRAGVRVWADGQLAVVRTALTVNGMDAWTLPRTSAGVGVLGLARW